MTERTTRNAILAFVVAGVAFVGAALAAWVADARDGRSDAPPIYSSTTSPS